MNRKDFEYLRDLEGKRIKGDIALTRKQAMRPLLSADGIEIENGEGCSLLMNINFNPEVGTKGITVRVAGLGPICRLDVDGRNHGDAGRSHKHRVTDERSVEKNLRDEVAPRPDLSGSSLRVVFETFCRDARIVHEGALLIPTDAGTAATTAALAGSLEAIEEAVILELNEASRDVDPPPVENEPDDDRSKS